MPPAFAGWATRASGGRYHGRGNSVVRGRVDDRKCRSGCRIRHGTNSQSRHLRQRGRVATRLAKDVSPDLVCPNGFVPLHYVVSGAIGRGSNNRVVPTKSARGGQLPKLRARPPQRARRHLRAQVLPPPSAGVGPACARVCLSGRRTLIIIRSLGVGVGDQAGDH